MKDFNVDLDEIAPHACVVERVNNEDLVQKSNFTINLEQDGK